MYNRAMQSNKQARKRFAVFPSSFQHCFHLKFYLSTAVALPWRTKLGLGEGPGRLSGERNPEQRPQPTMADQQPPNSINLPRLHTLAAITQMSPEERQALIDEAKQTSKDLMNYTHRNQTQLFRLLDVEGRANRGLSRWIEIVKRGRELLQQSRGLAEVYQNSPSDLRVNRNMIKI